MWRQTVTPRIVLGRPQLVMDRLWSDGYEDEWLDWGSWLAKYKSQHTVDRLRYEAMKTYDNVESNTGLKKDSWEVTEDSTEGCNQEGTLASNEQTLFWGLQRWWQRQGLWWGNLKAWHTTNILQSEGYETDDIRESYRIRKGVLIYNERLFRWLSPRQLQHTTDKL